MSRGAVLVLALLVAPACAGRETLAAPTPVAPPRPFAMGLSDFPHAFSLDALTFAAEAIRRDADLAMLHFDDGVPWEEAAAGEPYPAAYQAELERKARAQPPGHVRYLAVTPLNFVRDGLAPRRGPGGSEPLRAPWTGRAFDEPATIEAYAAHCERMIALFAPDHFVYGVEVNMLAKNRPEEWPRLVRLLSAVYARVKARHPALTVSLTFQVEFLRADPEVQERLVREVLPLSDMIGASSYAYSITPDPRRLGADYFDRLAGLTGGKRFFVGETGWPAEPVTRPYPAYVPASEGDQRVYVEWLLEQGERHRAVLVNWILARDYDVLWESHLARAPDAPVLRLFRDLGLYRGDGTPRPALDAWRAWLARPRG